MSEVLPPGEGPALRLFQCGEAPNPFRQFFNEDWGRRYCLDETTADACAPYQRRFGYV